MNMGLRLEQCPLGTYLRAECKHWGLAGITNVVTEVDA
jgi:hypothetical protein